MGKRRQISSNRKKTQGPRGSKCSFEVYRALSSSPDTQQRAAAGQPRTDERAQVLPLSPVHMTHAEPPFMGNLALRLILLGYLKNSDSFSCLISLGNWMTEPVYT